MNKLVLQFTQRLDQMLGIGPGKFDLDFADPPVRAALLAAAEYKKLSLEDEIVPNPDLRARWKRGLTHSAEAPARWRVPLAWLAAIVLFVALLALLFLFRQPILVRTSPLFGSIYLPDLGFFPISTTRMVGQPVQQENGPQTLSIIRGLGTPTDTRLWLSFRGAAPLLEGATLVNEHGQVLPVIDWQVDAEPNTFVVRFPAIPEGTLLTTLSLLEGWRLPLVWVPASASPLLEPRIEPYPTQPTP